MFRSRHSGYYHSNGRAEPLKYDNGLEV